MRTRRTLTAAALSAAVLIPLMAAPAMAAVTTTPTLLGTNASAAAKWQALNDLAVVNGEIYSAYGDYDRNVGPIDVTSLNTTTGAFTKHLTVNGEELMALRVVDGRIYTSDIDPKVSWTANAGYATNASGTWQYVAASPFIHVFDVAKLGSELFLAGSIVNPDPAKYGPASTLAAIKKSADGGRTWSLVKVRSSQSGSTDNDRYYWMAAVGGKLVTIAEVTDAKGVRNTTLDVYSNGQWSTTSIGNVGWGLVVTEANQIDVLGSKIIIRDQYGNPGYIDVNAKGKAAGFKVALKPTDVDFDDIYVSNGVAYAVADYDRGENAGKKIGLILTSRDGVTWKLVAEAEMVIPVRYGPSDDGSGEQVLQPRDYRSIAVSGGKMYLGGSDSSVYVAPAPAVG